MNKRNLALLISKHPLLRKLTEDKTIPNSVVARLIVEELMEAERETLSNKLTKLLAKGNAKDREKIIVDFFKVLKTGQGYEGLFPTWPRMPEEKKQAFIEAGKKFDINKGRAKQFTEQIIAATTPQEIQSGTEELIDDVEVQTGVDLDNTQPAAGKEIILTDEHKKIQRQLNAVLGALAKKPFYMKRSDGSYSEVVDIMFWPTSAVPLLKEKGHPQYDAPGLDKEIVLQQGVSKMASEKPLWNEVYKAKSHSWVFFIDPEKIQERIGTSKTYKVFNDVRIGDLIKNKIFLSVEKYQKLKSSAEQSTQTSPEELVDIIASTIVDMNKEDQFVTTYDQNAPAAIDFVLNNMPTEQVDVLKTAPPEEQQKVVKAVAAELEKDQQENPFKELQGYSELKLKPPEEKVFVQFLTKLQEAKIINEENLVQLSKIVGTGRGLSKIIKSFGGPERKILITVLQRVEVQKFIQNNLQQIEKPQEPGKEEKPSTPMKGEPVAIDPEQTRAFVAAANELLNDFYNQKYRKNQAIIVGKVIDSMKAFVEDADLALAFGKPPADKPEEQEATSEEPPKEQEATSEEPETIEEQEEQEVKADKDEMRNIRIGLRSFLSRVNKTNKYLAEFEKVAADGSVLSDAYKKKFMDNLKEIQTAIYRLALVLNKMLDSKEELNEKKGSETINKWKEVQKLYDLSIKSVSSVKELLDTETPPDELDSTLTNDAYTALIDLAGHFPSVAPFGAGKMKRSDFGEYKTKFANAIGQLKSDLQNVFNLIKTGEAGEESLQNARDGLRDFGDAIASIFGVASKFKDAKVKPGDDKAPAVQEDPEAEDTSDFPRDLPTQIKDTLDEYYGTYKMLKKILAKGLFKESIGDDYQALKGALASSKEAIKTIVTGDNYKDLIAVGEKDGVSREETMSMVGDMMRYFVRVYEELMKLYKKATEEPEEAKKPSWWKKLWPKTLEKFNKLKDEMKELYSKFEDWLVGKGLDIDLDLQPGDIPGTERPEVSVEEDYTEEIKSAEDNFKKILSREKFSELTGNSEYYGVFMKLVLVIYSQSPLNEGVRIGSINAPLVRAAPSGMFKQDILQDKLKRLTKNNQGLVREISEMMAAIPTNKMKLILDVVSKNKNETMSLDFEAILSKDFAKKEKTSTKQVKDPASLKILFTEKSSDFAKMVRLLKRHTRQPIQLRNALIVWYLMLNTTGTEEIKENNKKENNPGIFSKIPQKYRKEKSLNPAKILKVVRLLKKFNPILSKAISVLHSKVAQADLLRMYLTLDKIFKGTKISMKMDKMSINRVLSALSNKDAEEDTSDDVVDDSLLDKEDELEEQLANKLKPLIREMLTKGK